MSQPLFTGVGVALMTLFDSDGEVDPKGTAKHAARLVDDGMQAVLAAGSTGEAATLTREERIAVLEAVRSAVPDSVPVLAGTGAPSARQAAALTADARHHGADAVLVLSPPGSRRLGEYYQAAVAAAGEMPVLGYHFPGSSAPGIPVEALPSLPIRGLKDSSGDPERLLVELEEFGGWLYTGSSAILAYAGPLGATGAILALANAEPEACVAAFGGDVGAQRRLLPSHRYAGEEVPRNVKQLAAEKYGTSPACRV